MTGIDIIGELLVLIDCLIGSLISDGNLLKIVLALFFIFTIVDFVPFVIEPRDVNELGTILGAVFLDPISVELGAILGAVFPSILLNSDC